MNGYDATLYENIKVRVEELGMLLTIVGQKFQLQREGQNLGHFADLESLANYIYGYDTGFRAGKLSENV